MNKTKLTLIALSIGGVLLTSCVNLKPVVPKSQNYTLGPVEIQAVDQVDQLEQGTAVSEAIFITRPHVPTYLDSGRLVYLAESGEVKQVPVARWAEPMVEGIARATALYLNESTGLGTVVGYYPWPNSNVDAIRLTLNFLRFSATETGEVHVVARWTLKHSTGEIKSGLFSTEELRWTVAEPESLVAAYNDALKALAVEVLDHLD